MEPKDLKPLFEYFDEKFAENNARFDNIDGSLRVLQTSVDNLAKMVKVFHDEHFAVASEL